MTRLYIVDGYNFIIEDPDLSNVLDREGLMRARRVFRDDVGAFARRNGCRVRIIFDGATDTMSHDDRFADDHVDVSFTSGEEKADERVVAVALEARRRGEAPTIVSNDRTGVREPLAARGFTLITTKEFAGLIREIPRRRELRSEALSEDEKLRIAEEFLARDAERRRRKAAAPPAPATAPPVRVAPPRPAAAQRPVPHVPPSPVPGVQRNAERNEERDAKKERGKRKQARRLALIQSARKKR